MLSALLKKLGLFFIIAPILIVGILWFAPSFIPAEKYKDQVEEKLEDMTGRDVHINGDLRISFLPRLKLEVENVTLSHPKNLKLPDSEHMIGLNALYLSVRVLPLISGQISVDRFELIEPTIALAYDNQDQPNWVFETASAKESSPEEPADKSERDALADKLKELDIAGIAIEKGTVRFYETPSTKPQIFSNIHAKLQIPSLNGTTSIDFAMDHAPIGKLQSESTISSLGSLLSGKEAFITSKIALGDMGHVTLTGSLTQSSDGALQLKADVKGNASLEGQDITLSSKVNYTPTNTALDTLELNIDGTKLSGKFNVQTPEKGRMKIEGTLASDQVIDVVAMTKGATSSEAKEAQAAPKAASQWSSEPILPDLSFLRGFDALVTVKTPGVKTDTIVLGAFELVNTLKDGVARFQIAEMGFYEGTVAVDATLDARADIPSIVKHVTLSNVQAEPFLKGAYDIDRLTGTTNGKLSFRTKGVSEAAFVNNLNGSGKLSFQDGKIRGFSLTKLIDQARNLKSAFKHEVDATAETTSETPVTEFSSLTASFDIASGVLTNRDLLLKAPLLEATGAGTVNLPSRMVDYRIKPSIIGSAQGQDRTAETAGAISIPFRIIGPFEALKFVPDLGGLVKDLVKDPKGTIENIEKNLKGVKGDFKSILKGF